MTKEPFVALQDALVSALPTWEHTWTKDRITVNAVTGVHVPAVHRLLLAPTNYTRWATELQAEAHGLYADNQGVQVFGLHQIPDSNHKRYVIASNIRTVVPVSFSMVPVSSFVALRPRCVLDTKVLERVLGDTISLGAAALALRMLVSKTTDEYTAKVRVHRRALIEEIAAAFVLYDFGYDPIVLDEDALATSIVQDRPVSVAHDVLSAVQIQARVHEALSWE